MGNIYGEDLVKVAKAEDNKSVDTLLDEYDALSQQIVEMTASRNQLANIISERTSLQSDRLYSINNKFNAYINGDASPAQEAPRR